MNILVISHLYPNSQSPIRGVFVQQEVLGLAELAECNVTLMTPMPWTPRILWWNPKWHRYGQEPACVSLKTLTRYYPRYLCLPRQALRAITGHTLYFAVRHLADELHRSEKFDVVHGHTLIPDGYAAVRIGRRIGVPVVCTSHGSDGNVCPQIMVGYRKFAQEVISQADQVIAVSDALRQDLCDLAVPRRPIRTIPYGVDTGDFAFRGRDRNAIRRSLGIPQDALVLIFVGTISRDKGVYELIGAFGTLARQEARLHLVMLGNGPDLPHLRGMIASKPGLSRVRLVGQVPHMDVPTWLAASDVFVFPSYHEGMPNAVLEAMTCGLPVVATSVGGIPEVIQNSVTGLLVAPKDVDALVDALWLLSQDPGLRKELGEKGRRYVVNHFSRDRHVAEVLSVYEEVTDSE